MVISVEGGSDADPAGAAQGRDITLISSQE